MHLCGTTNVSNRRGRLLLGTWSRLWFPEVQGGSLWYYFVWASDIRGWQIPLPNASTSLGRASGFLVHNLITDKLKSRSDKSFENLIVSPRDIASFFVCIFMYFNIDRQNLSLHFLQYYANKESMVVFYAATLFTAMWKCTVFVTFKKLSRIFPAKISFHYAFNIEKTCKWIQLLWISTTTIGSCYTHALLFWPSKNKPCLISINM